MIELHQADILEWAPKQPADSVSLVFGSPPYCDARTYGVGAQRDCREWVAWMLEVSKVCARICTGPIFWVVAGVTRKRNYWPAPEGLMWQWWDQGGDCQLYRPCVFHRNGIPGSGGNDYLRADWEYVVCLKRPGKLPWSDNTAMGHTPKYAPGGTMSNRMKNGKRVNKAKRLRAGHGPGTRRKQDGTREVQNYAPPEKANPGNVISLTVGGGHLGSPLAHLNEAPFPEELPEFFIRSFCPPNGTVLDPFCGSGTTLAVARKWGRHAIGVDIRASQIELTNRRLAQQLLPF